MMHGGGWWSYLRYDESKGKPRVDRRLMRRVLAYARPYWMAMIVMLVAIVAIAFLGLIPPLLYRDSDRRRAAQPELCPAEPAGPGHDRHPVGQRPCRRRGSAI